MTTKDVYVLILRSMYVTLCSIRDFVVVIGSGFSNQEVILDYSRGLTVITRFLKVAKGGRRGSQSDAV